MDKTTIKKHKVINTNENINAPLYSDNRSLNFSSYLKALTPRIFIDVNLFDHLLKDILLFKAIFSMKESENYKNNINLKLKKETANDSFKY